MFHKRIFFDTITYCTVYGNFNKQTEKGRGERWLMERKFTFEENLPLSVIWTCWAFSLKKKKKNKIKLLTLHIIST